MDDGIRYGPESVHLEETYSTVRAETRKPYPFYDWVTTARQDIQARGEKPAPLLVEPGGAEFASPLKSFVPINPLANSPMRKAGFCVTKKDSFNWSSLVPAVIAPGESMRVHLAFRPDLQKKGHWNNEAEDLVLWVDPLPGWEVSSRYLSVANPKPS